MSRASLLAKGIGIAVALLVVGQAEGYVRTRSSSTKGTPAYWPSTCAFVQPDLAGTPDLPADQVFQTIQRSMQNWMTPDASCSYFQLKYDAPKALEAHLDGVNTVKFRTDTWCHPVDAYDKQTDPNRCYSSFATAITSVFMINDGGPEDGKIVDADIELNDINFTFVIIGGGGNEMARPGTTAADLENTLTHELGHAQGLSHTCHDRASLPNEVDQDGNPPPDCSALGNLPAAEFTAITEATMYNTAGPGEIKKRTPADDDVAGICSAYPIGKSDGLSCSRADLSEITGTGHGCQMGRAPQPLASVAFLLVLAFAAWRAVDRRTKSLSQ